MAAAPRRPEGLVVPPRPRAPEPRPGRAVNEIATPVRKEPEVNVPKTPPKKKSRAPLPGSPSSKSWSLRSYGSEF